MSDRIVLTPKKKVATIYDVAKRAGVSIKTVSMVLNDLPMVSAETRKHVREVIREMAYRPNRMARGLASQHSYMLGLFCDCNALGCNYITQIQMAILTTCQTIGYHLVVECLQPGSPKLADQARNLILESNLAGVILTPPLSDLASLIEVLSATSMPVARFSPARPVDGFIDVDMNNVAAGYDMTAYLLSLGHRRVGFVRGPADYADAHARYDGFRRAMADAGLDVLDEWCVQQDELTFRAGREAGEKLLALADRPTAILASNDDMAAGVLGSSLRLNLRVPNDLSVAGFDDSLFAQEMWPRLTTCRQPLTEMSNAVVSALVRRNNRDQVTILFPHKIIARESTCAPPRMTG